LSSCKQVIKATVLCFNRL